MSDAPVLVHPGPTITDPGVRPLPFSDPSLKSAIERTLSQLKDGETWAFVAVGEMRGNEVVGRMTINVRIPDHDKWSFGGYVEVASNNPIKAGVELRLAG